MTDSERMEVQLIVREKIEEQNLGCLVFVLFWVIYVCMFIIAMELKGISNRLDTIEQESREVSK